MGSDCNISTRLNLYSRALNVNLKVSRSIFTIAIEIVWMLHKMSTFIRYVRMWWHAHTLHLIHWYWMLTLSKTSFNQSHELIYVQSVPVWIHCAICFVDILQSICLIKFQHQWNDLVHSMLLNINFVCLSNQINFWMKFGSSVCDDIK